MELYVLYNEVEKLISAKGIKIHKSYVGKYFTSLDMMGMFYDENGKHVRTKKEILGEDGKMNFLR